MYTVCDHSDGRVCPFGTDLNCGKIMGSFESTLIKNIKQCPLEPEQKRRERKLNATLRRPCSKAIRQEKIGRL